MKRIIFNRCALFGLALAAIASAQPATQRSDHPPATNPAELSQLYANLIDAIARGDEAAVADAVQLPVKLSPDDARLYAKRIILGSHLQWLASEKLGQSGERAIRNGRLDCVPREDPNSLIWETEDPIQMTRAAGGLEQVGGKPAGEKGQWVFMVRTAQGWKFDRTRIPPALLRLDLEDAPWRNAIVQKVIEDVKSGKLIDASDLSRALLPQAPAEAPVITPGDRSTPESAVATMVDALNDSNASLIADSFRYMHKDERGAARRQQDALEAVTRHQLAKALLAKFGDEQGKRLIQDCSLGNHSFESYGRIRWAVDGDVARDASSMFYNVVSRMRRSGGVWRIELPPLETIESADADSYQDKDFRRWMDQRPVREMNLLAHLDRYPTPGSVEDVLNVVRATNTEPDDQTAAKELEKQVAEARRAIATQPAGSKQEAFEREFGLSLMEASAAALRGDTKRASESFFAEGDDGAYALARVQRTLAIDHLIETVDREIGGNAERPLYELMTVSDDMYGMVMLNWKMDGDRATGWHDEKPEKGATPDAKLRKVNGVWKIDVTDETGGDAKAAAQRAQEETRKLKLLNEQVKLVKFKTSDQFKKALSDAGFKIETNP